MNQKKDTVRTPLDMMKEVKKATKKKCATTRNRARNQKSSVFVTR